MSLNKVCLIGNLGADPEIRSFQDGGKIANLRIATSERWRDGRGEMQERTEWHNVVVRAGSNSAGLVGVAERFLRKGSKVYVEGKLAARKWTDQAGNDRWTTEVVLGGPRAVLVILDGAEKGSGRSGQVGGGRASQGSASSQAGSGNSSSTGFDDGLDDDEIPF